MEIAQCSNAVRKVSWKTYEHIVVVMPSYSAAPTCSTSEKKRTPQGAPSGGGPSIRRRRGPVVRPASSPVDHQPLHSMDADCIGQSMDALKPIHWVGQWATLDGFLLYMV